MILESLSSLLRRSSRKTVIPEEDIGNDDLIIMSPTTPAIVPVQDTAIISDLADLPVFKDILTLPGRSFELGDAARKQLAAINCESRVVILATPDANNRAAHLSLLDRIGRTTNNLIPIETLLVKPSVLLMINDKSLGAKARVKADRKSGQAADTIVLFKNYMQMAAERNASDVHIVIKKDTNSGAVLFRLDGIINFIDRVPFNDLIDAVGAAYTNLAEEGTRSEPTFNMRAMQSCRIPLSTGGQNYNLRWQSTPIVGGMHVVFRLLVEEVPGKEKKKTLEEQGYAPSHCRLLDLAVRKTIGVIFVVGPAGAGKSTLLKSLMTYLPDRMKRIAWSIEDPAEYKMFGVSQVSLQRSITEDSGFNPFIPAMRMVLRADPDTILVGEVRDKESLSLLKLMVQSGHQVMSSLHAKNAIAVVERLTSDEMGMSRQSLAARDFLSGIVFQQLVALLCPHCKLPATDHLDAETKTVLGEKFGMDVKTMFVKNEQGCPHCDHKGIKGRTVVAEVILPDHTYLKFVRDGLDVQAEEYWRGTRKAKFTEPDCTGKTALEHGLYKVHQGIVCPLDLQQTFVPYEVHEVIEMKEA